MALGLYGGRTIAIREPIQSEKRTIAIHIQRGNWGRKWGAGGTPAELKRKAGALGAAPPAHFGPVLGRLSGLVHGLSGLVCAPRPQWARAWPQWARVGSSGTRDGHGLQTLCGSKKAVSANGSREVSCGE